MAIWGPPGTQQMIAGMRAMYKFDLDHRVNQFNKLANLDWTVTQVSDGVIYRQDGVTVTAFSVEHDDGNPAFGYRIDYRGRSVVLSGDTTYSENVVRAGRGVDLIVQNVIAVPSRLAEAAEMKPIIGKLTTPEQAARVFTETRPRLAVFSHVVKKELSGRRGDDLILQRVRAAGYAGRMEMGRDRMIIDITDAIRITEPSSTDGLADVDRKAAYQ